MRSRRDRPLGSWVGLLVTLGSSLAGLAAAIRLQRWLILRYGTEDQRQEQEFWDGNRDDDRWWFEDRGAD